MRQIRLDDESVLPADGIVPAHLLETLTAVERFEAAARERAEADRHVAAAAARQAEETAREAGYAAGLDALMAVAAKVETAQDRLLARLDEQLRACLEHILGNLPRQELIEATLDNVLADMRSDLDVVIMVHPDNQTALEAAIDAYRERRGSSLFLRARTNERMAPDDCLIYAGAEVIEAGVPVVIEGVLSALRGRDKAEGADAD